MTIYIKYDSQYCYFLQEGDRYFGTGVEFTDQEMQEYNRIMKEYLSLQEFLKKKMKEPLCKREHQGNRMIYKCLTCGELVDPDPKYMHE